MLAADPIDLTTTGVAAGGAGVGRDGDGRVVFVRGALPGERVRVTVTDERKTYATATLDEVVEPAPDRTAPPCPHVADGCGGCDWQHVEPAAQPGLRARDRAPTRSSGSAGSRTPW